MHKLINGFVILLICHHVGILLLEDNSNDFKLHDNPVVFGQTISQCSSKEIYWNCQTSKRTCFVMQAGACCIHSSQKTTALRNL